MSLNILHQMGHNSVWNKESFRNDGIGSGLIYSPVHETCTNIEKSEPILKVTSYFDPQFYLPSSQKKKFQSYDFFPNTILGEQGFNTVDFSSVASESAKRCVDFQLRNNFEGVIIPARFYEQMHPQFIEQQNESFVSPFLSYIRQHNIHKTKKIYLSVPITAGMLNVGEYKNNILNWVTSHPEISGVYFICQHDRNSKQITDESFLVEYMDALHTTAQADLDVIIGYTNTESILYTLCGEVTLTIGAFENTRIFSLDKFIVSDEERRGPKPRIYMPKLLNWINFEEATLLAKEAPELWKKLYCETSYSRNAFEATKTITFQSPLLYKDYFINFNNQINRLSEASIVERREVIVRWIDEAFENYEKIENYRKLEKNGSSSHLLPWLNAIKSFSNRISL
ncbi:hypothetical protein A6J66_013850 [Yersinia enterocolitica]|nr:hypothetical protein A6J66_013850 [Yersinia enterocolitica]